MRHVKAFTVIELMVVISIIALLASIILVSLKSSTDKARLARAKTEMQELVRTMLIAQGESADTLDGITGTIDNYCPGTCVCSPSTSAAACQGIWDGNLEAIRLATNGVAENLSAFAKDPWGRPYRLDVNEIDLGTCTEQDTLTTCGPTSDCSESYTAQISLSGYCIPS